MGSIARFLGWMWRRWADYNSLMALLDFLDAKTLWSGVIAWVAMMLFGSTNTGWSPQGVVLAAFVVAACVVIIVVAMRLSFSRSVKAGNAASVASVLPLPEKLEPNIGARDAYFLILADSVWKRQQLATTLVTKHIRRDWLEFRLHKEIHDALRNNQVSAWGEECLHGMVTTPEKPIPVDVWDKAELVFDSNPTLVRTSAYLKGRVTYEKGRSVWVGVKFCREEFFCRFPIVSVSSQRDLAQQLDNLYAVGVGERNRLMPTIPEFELDKETMIFTHWDNRVLALLDADFVNVAEKSSFRTLNLFQGISADAPNKTAEQRHIEAMWTEKLNRLKPIIDRVGR
ncbi:MAG TPA: hypothetical protein VK653_11015 [Xanthobacteraceae bacterium]|nr:hypothetical protein [Xanthobacteraceae bacterium]